MGNQDAFLEVWYNAMIVCGIISFTVGLIIYLVHNFRVALIKDFKEKYDFINANEVRWYKWTFIAVAVGVGFLINLYGSNESGLNKVEYGFSFGCFLAFQALP